MMEDLDVLLMESNPLPELSGYACELATEIARSKARRHPRRRLLPIIASVLGGSLVLGGGVVAAAAQAGWLGADRYVDGPDMTGVLRVHADGVAFDCTYTLHTEADYTQTASYQRITDGVAEAHRYLRSLDPKSIKPDLTLIDPNVEIDPMPGTTAQYWRARMIFEAWTSTVTRKVDAHLKDLRFPDVAMSSISDCEAVPTK